MAFSGSGLFYLTLRDILQNDTAVDLLVDSIKVALFTNSVTTPNYSTNTAYAAAPFNANEVGTPSGGVALGSPTITVAAGNLLTFDANDTAWSSQTISLIRGALGYDDSIATPTAKPAVFAVDFTSDYSVTSGIFTIQWATAGIFTIDVA